MATKTKSKMSLQPLDDRVVVRPTQAAERTAAGIFLPNSAQEKPQQGKIVSTGPGKINDDNQRTPVEVKPGDVVLYGKYGGTEIEIDGEKLVILRESELLAKLD